MQNEAADAQADFEYKERFELLAQATQDAVWDWNLETNMIWWNEGFKTQFGYRDEDIEPGVESWYNRIHPDDRQRVVDGIRKVIDHGGRNWSDEYRFLKADGTYAEIFDRGHTLYKNGKTHRMLGSMMNITASKKVASALRQSEDRLRVAIESTELGTWDFNPVTGELTWSDRCKELFGLPGEEEVTYDLFLEGLYPEDREKTDQVVQKTLAGENEGHYDIEYRTVGLKDKKLRWVRAKGRAYFDHKGQAERFIGTVLDITEQKRNELELKVSEERFRNLFNNASVGMTIVDLNGRFQQANPVFIEMIGYSDEELRKMDLATITHPGDIEHNLENIRKTILGEIPGFKIEKRYIRKNGEVFWGEVWVSLIGDAAGNAKGLIAIVLDVTQQKNTKEALKKSAEELEQRVEERTAELKQANDRLEKSNNELEQFAYVASHDLQEPLRKIQIFGDRLQNQAYEQLTNEGKSWMDKILGSAQRMSSLIKDLLDYSRLSPSRVENKFSKISLNEVVGNILNDLELVITQRNALINVGELPVVNAVELQMNQLFYNLIANSLKFAAKDRQPIISINAENISERDRLIHHLQEGKDYVKLVFADNGIGFKQEFADQIFIIFQRLNTRDKYPGTGIGLALCRRVVDNHHGIIYAEAKEGEGARFIVMLPVVQ